MSELRQSDQLIINALIDRGVFTRTAGPQMTKADETAIQALKRPQTQQRINHYLKELVGMPPANYQENLVWFIGQPQLPIETVHVLLATLKAVINLPEAQQDTERIVNVKTIVRQVHSEVTELDEREVQRQITNLFVNRYHLFIPDAPVVSANDIVQKVTEFWDINPDFNSVSQCLVDQLQQSTALQLTDNQRVNRALLERQFISAEGDPELWQILQAHQATIVNQWQQLGRFNLECSQTYALLLDMTRRPVTARTFVVAIAVAHQLGVGVPVSEINAVIHRVMPSVLGEQTVSLPEVKKAMLDNGLAVISHDFYCQTALTSRFAVATNPEERVVHATE